MKYKHKIITSGNVIELYTYEREVRTGKDADKEENNGRRGNGKELFQEGDNKNRSDALQKAKKRLRREINSNIDQWGQTAKFFTLTYAEHVTDIEESNYEFMKFIQRLNYQLKIRLKYSAVIEFTKRGRIHYHLVTYNLPYTPNKQLAEIWGHGFVKINKIDQVDNVGAYVTKYMTKDNDDPRLKGKKCHFSSRGLKKPTEEIIDEKQKESLEQALEQYEAFRADFDTDYLGKITYRQYNTKRHLLGQGMKGDSIDTDAEGSHPVGVPSRRTVVRPLPVF